MLSEQIRELEQRLEAGWWMCEAERDHDMRVRLEDYFLKLLREYEQLVDQEHRQQDVKEAA